MLSSAIVSLTVELSVCNSVSCNIVSTITGEQGSDWNIANIDISSLANETSAQFRISVVTGSGDSGWQSDIAIDAFGISNDIEDPNPTTCDSLNFNNFSVTSFSNQDSDGTFSVTNTGSSLNLTNNTWKYITLNYEVTSSTVVEFEFSSTSEGEIHGIGFESDYTLTSSMYFKVHGSQNYGTTNYDNYVSGTTTYIIPVGSFYTGTMDRLVILNNNDSGTGNTSTFNNVKIYEGTCEASSRKTVSSAVTPVYGNTAEGILTTININPNPSANIFSIHLKK